MLGADLVAMAQPIFATWQREGASGLEAYLEEFIAVSRLIWRSTGEASVASLRGATLY